MQSRSGELPCEMSTLVRRWELRRRVALFEVEEDVHNAFGGIGAEPVADIFVVDGEIAEDLRRLVLEFGEIGFEF